MTSLDQRIGAAIGADRLMPDPSGFALGGRIPAAVVTPQSVEELSIAMAIAFDASAPVIPWGGGTRQTIGRLPQTEAPPLVFRTAALNRIRDYTPDDLAISVEAGMTMEALRKTLAANQQMLPLEAPRATQATVGGTLAVDADGPRRYAYGGCRDMLVGVQVVEATGRVSKAGGIVVKNVSGFDLMKLYVGSLGALAIITGANFKLLPMPRAAETMVARFASRAAAFAFVDALQASFLTPAACEFSDCGWDSERGSARVAVLAEGLPAAVARHRADLERLAAASAATEARFLAADQAAALWARIADFPAAGRGDTLVRLAALPSQLGAALNAAESEADRHGVEARATARALGGVAYLRATGDKAGAWLRALRSAMPAVNLAVLDPGPMAGSLPDDLQFGKPPAGLPVMRAIKAEFDPRGMLNPGRTVIA